jgi:TBC1 domain family member 23 (HCV non-structural protein 4A- transactivated protein 1).
MILNKTHLFVLREIPHNKGYAKVISKRPLEMIVQITSKRKIPNLITIKYGQTNPGSESGPQIVALDRLKFPEPYHVTRLVKQQVIKALSCEDETGTGESEQN